VRTHPDIALVSTADSRDWDAFVDAHPASTIYHTTVWAEVAAQTFGHSVWRLAERDSNGCIVGVLPLFGVRTLSGRALVSVPLRDRGGMLASCDETRTRLLQTAMNLVRSERFSSLEIRDGDGCPADLVSAGLFAHVPGRVISVLDLASDEESMWTAIDKGEARTAVRKAERSGLTARFGTADDNRAFYRLFLRTRRRLGVPPYPFRLFEAIATHLMRHGKALLAVIELESRVVAAAWAFVHGSTMIYAYGASDETALPLRPNDLLIWTLIRNAIERRLRMLDFGGDQHNQASLIRFKRKWGSRPVALSTWTYTANGRTPTHWCGENAAVDLARAVFRLLPMPVFRKLEVITSFLT
jgi:FemAB-related protein (PEP-CTERM system-associated)